jgi:HK97 gp10 family phage protein
VASRAGLRNRDRMRRILKAAPDKQRKALRAELKSGAEQIAAGQRQLAPVMTGRLRDSIVVTPGDEDLPKYAAFKGKSAAKGDPALTMIITAGNSGVRYAHLVEFGTEKAHAQPFFFTVFRALKKTVQSRVNKAAKQAIKDAAKVT